MSTYCLDVTYASDVTPHHAGNSIALAYGYGFLDPNKGHFIPQGQRAEKVLTGDYLYFSFFDTAIVPGTISEIVIVFHDGQDPFDWEHHHLFVPNPGMLIPSYKEKEASAGCNVVGRWYELPKFAVKTPEGKKVTYDCSIKVIVTPVNGDPQLPLIFKVDPRIIVNGGN